MNYLVIGEITEYEEILSFSAEPNGLTFTVVINASNTATQLLNASARGDLLPLVVIATDGLTYALDNVYVSEASLGSTQDTPQMTVAFSAEAVRFV